jgi:hypothetical protein
MEQSQSTTSFLRSDLKEIRSFSLLTDEGQKLGAQEVFNTYYSNSSEFSIKWANMNGGSSNVSFSPWHQYKTYAQRTQNFTVSVLGKEYQCEEMHRWSIVNGRGVFEARNELGLPFECVSEFRVEFTRTKDSCSVSASAGVFFCDLPYFLACQIRHGVCSQFTTSFENMENVMKSVLNVSAMADDQITEDSIWNEDGCIITLESEDGHCLEASLQGHVSIRASTVEAVPGARCELPHANRWRVYSKGLQHVKSGRYLGFDLVGNLCCKASACGPWEHINLSKCGETTTVVFPNWDFGRGGSLSLSSGQIKCNGAKKGLEFQLRAVDTPGTRDKVQSVKLNEEAHSTSSREQTWSKSSFSQAAVLAFPLMLLALLGNAAAEAH